MVNDMSEKNRGSGLPAEDSIVDRIEFPSPKAGLAGAALPGASAGTATYTILRTNETDGYEPDLAPAAVPALAAPAAAPPSDSFGGTARRRAKTSIAAPAIETFADVSDLIGTLPGHQDMVDLHIPIGANSGRVSQERRNVRIAAFLYAASREDDNDFHLIIGRESGASPPLFMTVEISGLPPATSTHLAQLTAARAAYKGFFGAHLPGTSYDFYTPPIPVEIEGSLFFDASHSTGSRPGPSSLRKDMPVVWEVHPVSKIAFEP
jgi:hypothetical protein